MQKLEFTLKQHTPLIHFQHDQAGATLRATEVKPKLDQFLIEELLREQKVDFNFYEPQRHGEPKFINSHEVFNRKAQKPDNDDQKLWINWLVGNGKNEHVALDYKVSVVCINNIIELITEDDKIPMYFGNMGDDYAKKPMCLATAEKVKVQIISLNQDIRTKIKEIFPFFLAKNNFGTRQNKGYGSFFFHKDDINGYLGIDQYLKGITCLRIQPQEWINMLFVINYYYQRLKSGVNYYYLNRNTGRSFVHYHPSFFRDFMYSNHSVQWEKPWLKQKFFPVAGVLTNTKFTRALLGLSPKFEFKNRQNPSNPGPATYPSFDFGVDVKHDTIDRHKSPITFKPVINNNGAEIYVIPENRFWDPICNQSFSFEGNGRSERLSTPSAGIDLSQLISQYNKSLKYSFTAIDFTGRNSINVSIK